MYVFGAKAAGMKLAVERKRKADVTGKHRRQRQGLNSVPHND